MGGASPCAPRPFVPRGSRLCLGTPRQGVPAVAPAPWGEGCQPVARQPVGPNSQGKVLLRAPAWHGGDSGDSGVLGTDTRPDGGSWGGDPTAGPVPLLGPPLASVPAAHQPWGEWGEVWGEPGWGPHCDTSVASLALCGVSLGVPLRRRPYGVRPGTAGCRGAALRRGARVPAAWGQEVTSVTRAWRPRDRAVWGQRGAAAVLRPYRLACGVSRVGAASLGVCGPVI